MGVSVHTIVSKIAVVNKSLEEKHYFYTEIKHKGKELFDQLNYAYIGGRYRSENEFPITREKIDFCRQETERFMEITRIICSERIINLKRIMKYDMGY